MSVQFDPGTQLLLFLMGVIAGAVDAVAGGGGIITVPVLLTLGHPLTMTRGARFVRPVFLTMVVLVLARLRGPPGGSSKTGQALMAVI